MERISTVEKFQEITSTEQPVIVKFTAGWCPDCVRMNMFIDPIIEEYNEYKWFEVDRDELMDIAEQQEVRGIPSLLIFKNGEKLAHLHSANAKSPEQVTDFLDAQK
ncbi:thioredoxin family protein [Caryophanon latum]|uniref:Thiol reductase thioredoxin n=1 Tax=Caryophanon latum TaxID=33977 RepID=A0A1C0YZI6_9BACL|nr:thioredoxin family protein [Caryophanon latum]OCS92535.1 thiol reductase thioredoxin [Caryophanon latum]